MKHYQLSGLFYYAVVCSCGICLVVLAAKAYAPVAVNALVKSTLVTVLHAAATVQ